MMHHVEFKRFNHAWQSHRSQWPGTSKKQHSQPPRSPILVSHHASEDAQISSHWGGEQLRTALAFVRQLRTFRAGRLLAIAGWIAVCMFLDSGYLSKFDGRVVASCLEVQLKLTALLDYRLASTLSGFDCISCLSILRKNISRSV